MKEQLFLFGESFIFAVVALAFMLIAKLYRDWRTSFDDDHEIEEKSNAAVGLRRAGLFLGTAIGISGILANPAESSGFLEQLKFFALDAVIVIVLLLIARFLNDVIFLRGINNDKAVEEGNASVGFVECGSYIATGLILFGVFSGTGGGIAGAIGFAALGQVALFILYLIYQAITPFDVTEEIKNGNVAAGLAVAGMLTALGIILKTTVSGTFVSWSVSIGDFAMYTVFGIVMLLIFRWVIDLVFLPNTKLSIEIQRDKNVAAIALTEGAIIGLAVIISNLL